MPLRNLPGEPTKQNAGESRARGFKRSRCPGRPGGPEWRTQFMNTAQSVSIERSRSNQNIGRQLCHGCRESRSSVEDNEFNATGYAVSDRREQEAPRMGWPLRVQGCRCRRGVESSEQTTGWNVGQEPWLNRWRNVETFDPRTQKRSRQDSCRQVAIRLLSPDRKESVRNSGKRPIEFRGTFHELSQKIVFSGILRYSDSAYYRHS